MLDPFRRVPVRRHAPHALTVVCLVAILILGSLPVVLAQKARHPQTALAAIVFPGVKSPPSSFGVYLGQGLVLTNWHVWTLDGRLYTSTDSSFPTSRQIQTYDADGIDDPGEFLLDRAQCEAAWVPLATADAGCTPFARIKGAGFLFPQVGDDLTGAPVPVRRLLWASRHNDLALLEVDAALVEARGVQPVRINALPTTPQQPVRVVQHVPGERPADITATLETGTPALLPTTATRSLGAPWRVPSLQLDTDAVYDGAPVLDAENGELLGLVWRTGTAPATAWVTPAALWLHALYAANDALQNPALSAVLAAANTAPVAAPPTLGDPLTPSLGNAGIDVQHYELALAIDPSGGTLTGSATLDIRATVHRLQTFALDARALEVTRIAVDGRETAFVVKPEKLIIDLPQAVDFGTTFTVRIDYTARPQPFISRFVPFFEIGMFAADDRVSTLNQPDGAHTWFPCNDHPSDRATFDLFLRVREPLEAISNGELVAVTSHEDGTRTFHWRMAAPMATYLTTLAVADYVALEDATSDGIRITNYVYPDQQDAGRTVFSYTDDALALLEGWFGPYPFDRYGHVVVHRAGMALETQALTTMPDEVLGTSELTIFPLVVHELAHQWFGNTVTLGNWADIWLNEGFATYAEWLVREVRLGRPAAIAARSASEETLLYDTRTTPLVSPRPEEMLSVASYDKGAWVLHMLRQEIGDEAFVALLHAYVAAFRDRPVDTIDFWQLAESVSGVDLDLFFTQWLLQGGIPRFMLYWSERENGAAVLICPTGSSSYTFDLPLLFTGNPDQRPVALAVTASAGQATYELGFVPTQVTVDPDQALLAQVQVQPIRTLPAACPPFED